jgi:glycosyltransferase involved in cell wall biosynthesis
VVHLFYPELWSELVGWIRNISCDFDLFVTVPETNATFLETLVTFDYPDAAIVAVPNLGRDVGAFLRVLPSLLDGNYDVLCKIHTKKGATQPDTWRYLALRALLGSEKQILDILNAFARDPDLYMVGEKDFYLSGPTFIGGNADQLRLMMMHAYGRNKLPRVWGFFAGTMFWCRVAGLARISRAFESGVEFETDNRTIDGQAAHAVERLFSLGATLDRKKVGLVGFHSASREQARIEVQPADSWVSTEELAFLLNRRAAEPRVLPSPRRQRDLRDWRVPDGATIGVNLIGPVEYLNGVAISCRGYLASLEFAGVSTNVVPWHLGFDRLQRVPFVGVDMGLQPINLVHLNLDLLATGRLLEESSLASIVVPDRYNIAIVYWELMSIPEEHASVIRHFDEVWCASSFAARAVSAVTARPTRIVRPALKRSGSVTPRSRAYFGLPTDRFVFFYAADAGSILSRKNPRALLDAYLAEFAPDDGACCAIKITYAQRETPEIQAFLTAAETRKDIVFIDQVFEDDEMADLFSQIDCYVSPHRSEGLGLTLIEAMSAGKPVISTPYGGVTDFVTDRTAFLLDYRLVEVGEGNAPYPPSFIWAEPERESIRRAMRAVTADSDATARIAASGRAAVSEMFGLEQTAATIDKEIRRIWTLGGGVV